MFTFGMLSLTASPFGEDNLCQVSMKMYINGAQYLYDHLIMLCKGTWKSIFVIVFIILTFTFRESWGTWPI